MFEQLFPDVAIKQNNEADVRCPFHDDNRPSAHINFEKRVFHCKTCSVEGLSEAGFIAKYYDVTYSEAIKLLSKMTDSDAEENWSLAVDRLLENKDMMHYLTKVRGLTPDTIKQHQLGYNGAGIIYPVFFNGVMVDKRTYLPDGQPKIKSQKGASVFLFPFDEWQKSEGTTFICAGENDTLLLRQYGYNAVTSTLGEGSFPDILLGMFKGKEVYLCYDCDDAGKQGALKVAFKLYEAGATVRIIDLGLEGTKQSKDITDFFLKENKTLFEFKAVVELSTSYSGEQYTADKNIKYPIVELWKVPHGQYANKYISSRVIMTGKYDLPLEVPTAVEWHCNNPKEDNVVCKSCSLNGRKGWWQLDDSNLNQLMELVEVTSDQQDKSLNKFIRVPNKCPGIRKTRRERKHVQKVIFSPDVESEGDEDYKSTEHYAYTLGLDLEDGQRYRAYFKRYPHPKTQTIMSVVDRVEASDNAINTFKLTPEIIEGLEKFTGSPDDVMAKRFEEAKQIVGAFAPQQVVEAVAVMYHSVLDFKYAGKEMKGHPEGLIVGASRTGKTDTTKKYLQFLGLGNLTDCKTATVAGLLGGADKLPNGGHRIRWGKIPRNHKGLLVLDELSGMSQNVMSSMTALRSERIARLEKIVSGSAPAKTRMLWISNPRVQSDNKSKNIALYSTGVEIILDLIGSDEDVARFDFTVILPNNDSYISPFSDEGKEVEIDNTHYRNLVHYAWSRTADQITWAHNVEQYVWVTAQELNERYDTDVKFFGAEAHKKLARIAVSCAIMCFSHDGTGEKVVVKKEHVDWAKSFLVRCYDNDVFRLKDYVEQQRTIMTTNEEINTVFAGLVKSQAMLMKTLNKGLDTNLHQLRTLSGLDQRTFDEAISNMVRHGLLEVTKNGVIPTLRFRRAKDAYVGTLERQRLTPLSEQGRML